MIKKMFFALKRVFTGFAARHSHVEEITSVWILLKVFWLPYSIILGITLLLQIILQGRIFVFEYTLSHYTLQTTIVTTLGLILIPQIGFFVSEMFEAYILNRVQERVSQQGQQFFLTVDPIYHTTKSTGMVLSKLQRGISAINQINNIILYEILSTVIAITVVLFSVFRLGWIIGGIGIVVIAIMLTLSIMVRKRLNSVVLPYTIKAQDGATTQMVRSIQQFFLIRGAFATDIEVENIHNATHNEAATNTAEEWFTTITFYVFIRSISLCAVTVLILYVMNLYYNENMRISEVITYVVVTMSASRSIERFGRVIQQFQRRYAELQDYFTFREQFGTREIPTVK